MRTAGRWLTLAGYFGLFFLILLWTTLIAPPQHLPRALVLLVLLLPLLAPLRGLLHGRPYTHAWTSLLSLFYVALGITLAAMPEERVYGLSMLVFGLMLFTGCLLYLRRRRPLAHGNRRGTGSGTG
ncbi:Protein of unknown function DUF2069, membrane [Thioalkalivibrio nitratireducens DSM 14787]|uniref:Transmembrane protein n=1 Tax=Thioalkalivibrio nitratireducens (strain DSM 14787 / UNIQEM 213 / ALEN2) TaxID=1255043 RepID=L0E321_THIND|nr:DUF2069 domain-containing protein [Thioalkalivibrio nitratireducens]AGA35031.1 Protein of unknown function DUF2069, membrane [Thioalkalivibrio nitratireducens DSM 14787]